MLYIDRDNNIKLTRGDTAYIDLSMAVEETGEPYDYSNDVTTFSVKTDAKSDHIVFEKIISGTVIKIDPEDTINLDFQTLKYDVHLVKPNGDTYTVIEERDFVIGREDHRKKEDHSNGTA